jgi:hypothetical protein
MVNMSRWKSLPRVATARIDRLKRAHSWLVTGRSSDDAQSRAALPAARGASDPYLREISLVCGSVEEVLKTSSTMNNTESKKEISYRYTVSGYTT